MSHHSDYDGKTKAERRERYKEKRRARMDAGKRIKLLHRLAMRRAGVPEPAPKPHGVKRTSDMTPAPEPGSTTPRP